MVLKIEEVRKITDIGERTAAAEALRAYAAEQAEAARIARDQGVRELRAGGMGPAEIVRVTGVNLHTVKILVRGMGIK